MTSKIKFKDITKTDWSKEMKQNEKKESLEEIDFTVDLEKKDKKVPINQVVRRSETSDYSNMTNMTNMTNTYILNIPETKQDKIFYFLFDNGEQTADKLVEVGNLESKDAFYKLKQRQKDKLIISRKEGTISYYDLSLEMREKIKFNIEQKKRQIEEERKEKLKIKVEEEKREEIILKLKSLINENKRLIERKKNSIYLNLNELIESSNQIYDYFMINPHNFIKDFKIVMKDFGFENYNLRFSGFSDLIDSKPIENLRNTDIDKIVLIKARVSSLSDVRPQITEIKFECPSCGTILPIKQIESKIREPSRCSCGRRHGFKQIERKLVDRAKAELQDLIDLTESPQTREISSFIYNHLTESKELSKLNPGSEVKVLAILKAVESEKGGIKTTILDYYLEILEVEPFEEVIDLNSFEEEEINQFREISAIISNENKLDKLRNSFSPDIIGNDKPKDALILKQAQGRGKKNKSNIAFFSNPGLAKSIMAKNYHSLMPGSSYTSGSGSSAVGLTATVEKKEDGWICKPGVLPTTKEDAIIDEFNLINEEERPKLQEAMSEGQITINKASIHTKLKVSCGIVACANPINGVFNEDIDLVKQFNLPPQILNRFDALFVIKDQVNENEDKKIAKQMILRNENKINQELSPEFLKRFFLYIRNQSEPKFDNSIIEYISKKYSDIRKRMKFNKEKKLINARFNEAIIRFSKAMAKLKMKDKVSKEDVDFSLDLLKNTYLDFEYSFDFNN